MQKEIRRLSTDVTTALPAIRRHEGSDRQRVLT